MRTQCLDTSLPTFRLNFKLLYVELRNSTLRLPERANENKFPPKKLIPPSIETTKVEFTVQR